MTRLPRHDRLDRADHASMPSPAWRHFILGVLALVLLCSAGGTAAWARSDTQPPEFYGRHPNSLYANREPYLFYHDVGLLKLGVTNMGMIGLSSNTLLSAGWRGGEYLFVSGLWIGAIGADSEPHVSTGAGQRFTELLPELNATWTVYESFEGIRGGNRLGEADPRAADDDGDAYAGGVLTDPALVDEDFQDGLDNDFDGRIDEDFAAIGQQMFSATYRDDTPQSVTFTPDHVPLNVLVRQRSFQWSTAGINEFVGFEFEIINVGDQRLKELYCGFFSDSDAGPKTTDSYWTDDLVGWAHIDTTVADDRATGPCSLVDLAMDAAYMWDAPDNGTSIIGGDVPGVFGSLFLGHTTDDTGIRAPQVVGLTTVAWFSATGANADPQDDDERYRLLASETRPMRNAVRPDDYRYVIAAGPFSQLYPGESLRFQTAYVIGEGQDGFRYNAVNAQRVFNGRYIDADQNPETGVGGFERCLQILGVGESITWDDPCDTLNTTTEYRRTPPCNQTGAVYVDADCNPCTGIYGQESLINWVGTTAPAPPNINTDPDLDPLIDPHLDAYVPPAGDRRVVLQWDNASELRVDPMTGETLFEGYRVWRVDNWSRPAGSIGPSPEEWMKIAEFRENPEIASAEGARHLREIRRRGMPPIGQTEDEIPKDIYPIGYYSYEDTLGILNGKLYFYAVTAFGVLERLNPITGRRETVDLGGQPSAVEAQAVVPRWDASAGCENVKVVPNPYRGGADWDLIPSDHDPTGSKIAFINLPPDECLIRIYTLAGDLVLAASHDGGQGDGTFFWNMITRNGQNVTSGIYLYSIEHPGAMCRGRFVIIR